MLTTEKLRYCKKIGDDLIAGNVIFRFAKTSKQKDY